MMPSGAVVAGSTILTALSVYLWGGPSTVMNSVRRNLGFRFGGTMTSPGDDISCMRQACNVTVGLAGASPVDYFERDDVLEPPLDVHFIDPHGTSLPSDPFLPPFEMVHLTREQCAQILGGRWLIVG